MAPYSQFNICETQQWMRADLQHVKKFLRAERTIFSFEIPVY